MLDTNARKYVSPLLEKSAKFFICKKFSATQITFLALIIGLVSALFLVFDFKIIAVIILWISGFFDALDGTIARVSNSSSKLGGFLDIVFDRVVEIAILIGLCIVDQSLYIYVIMVLCTIILSMTVFLTSGALVDKESNKEFYYQSGLAERTEGFIMLSLAIIFINYNKYILIVFAAMIFITAIQRFMQTVKILKECK